MKDIPAIQVSFMYILKISATKSVEINVSTIAKYTDRNSRMRNVIICQISSIRKMSAKLCKMFPNVCKVFLKQVFWTLDVEKFKTIMLNIPKTHNTGNERSL